MSVPNAPLEQLGHWGRLGLADTIQVEGQRHQVRGWIVYDDEWVEYLLDDGRWLCVEAVGRLKFSVWDDQTGPCPCLPDDVQFTHGGVQFVRTESYRSRWLAAGIEGLTGPGTVSVTEYAGPGSALAAIEDWGDGPEWSLGRELGEGSVGL